MNEMILSVILGTYNRKRYLIKAITSIRNELNSTSVKFEIIVIDGGSNDGTINWLIKQKDIISIIQHNRGKWKKKGSRKKKLGIFYEPWF